MYCVKCGVELADSEKACPLCKTPVYYPGFPKEEARQYPEFVSFEEKISPRGVYFVLAFLFGIAIIITAICDYNLNGQFTWGGYAVGGMVLAYTVFLFPLWFRRRSPLIFLSADFSVLALYLFYVNYALMGDWFFSFALPVTGALALIALSSVAIHRYVRRGLLYVAGGALIATGFFTVLLEWLLNRVFHLADRLMWAYYPMIALSLFGIMLIIIASVKPLRESLRKRFYLS